MDHLSPVLIPSPAFLSAELPSGKRYFPAYHHVFPARLIYLSVIVTFCPRRKISEQYVGPFPVLQPPLSTHWYRYLLDCLALGLGGEVAQSRACYTASPLI